MDRLTVLQTLAECAEFLDSRHMTREANRLTRIMRRLAFDSQPMTPAQQQAIEAILSQGLGMEVGDFENRGAGRFVPFTREELEEIASYSQAQDPKSILAALKSEYSEFQGMWHRVISESDYEREKARFEQMSLM